MAMSIRSVSGRDEAPWLNAIGIDKRCRLVGMCRGMVTLTAAPDGDLTVWIYNHPFATGPSVPMRELYNAFLLTA